MITAGVLNEVEGVRHAFFTRNGGVSEGVYASLNCGRSSRDDPERVAQNRSRAMARLGQDASALATTAQVHGHAVARLDRPPPADAMPRADGMVTARPGVVLGILTADCAPILFADPEARVIGAAHAGWRGALSGILEATVAAMVAAGARSSAIVAAIGPCIAQRSYEVGAEFPAPFLAEDPAAADLFAPARREGHHLFDLKGYVARRLARLGLAGVAVMPNDTCREADRFFSYRRCTLNGEPDFGRGLSAIVLEP